jgi:hypothetical protein
MRAGIGTLLMSFTLNTKIQTAGIQDSDRGLVARVKVNNTNVYYDALDDKTLRDELQKVFDFCRTSDEKLSRVLAGCEMTFRQLPFPQDAV